MFDLYLLSPAVRFIESLDEKRGDLSEVRRLLDLIAQDPFWDQRTKFPFQIPPVIVSLYDSGRFRIVYHILNSATIEVWGIGFSDQETDIR